MTRHTATVSFVPSSGTGATFAAQEGDGADHRHIEGTAFAVGTPSGPSADGFRYQFASLPDNADELVDVVNEHDGWSDPIGRLAAPFALGEDGQLVPGRVRIFDTTAGRDVLTLAREGVKGGFSVSAAFDSFDQDEDGVRHVPSWSAIHLGVVRHPAFTESRGLTLAASAASTTKEGSPMQPEAPAAPPATASFAEVPTVEELARQVNEFNAAAAQANVHPLAQFSSHQAFTAAFLGADEEERRRLSAAFAIPTQTTADIPGLMLPAWRTRLVANLDARRPAISAFGGSIGLPDGGMKVEWPVFRGDLDGMIARQLQELEELSGIKITIESDDETILTAGAASTISYQALMRSSPAFLAQYQAIMDAAWARYTEAVYELSLVAKSTDAGALPAIAAGAKPNAFKALLFDASAQVEDATGAPANVVLVSSDVYSELGAADLPNPKEGSQGDGVGTADASTLTVSINGLAPKRAPFLPAGTVIVSNDQVAKFSEQGPMLATEENVKILGRDVATWGMYVPSEVYYPAGLLRFDRTA